MKPDYEVLELQLSGTAQLLAQERRDHAATAQALSDAEIGGRNAFVMAAAGHEYCAARIYNENHHGPGWDVEAAEEDLFAAHDATTPSPEQAYVVVSKERLARLEAIESLAEQWIIAEESMPQYAAGAEQRLIELVKAGAS